MAGPTRWKNTKKLWAVGTDTTESLDYMKIYHFNEGYLNLLKNEQVLNLIRLHFIIRGTSDPSGTAQNEQNKKPWTAPLVQGDQISDIIWRGSKCLGILILTHA